MRRHAMFCNIFVIFLCAVALILVSCLALLCPLLSSRGSEMVAYYARRKYRSGTLEYDKRDAVVVRLWSIVFKFSLFSILVFDFLLFFEFFP